MSTSGWIDVDDFIDKHPAAKIGVDVASPVDAIDAAPDDWVSCTCDTGDRGAFAMTNCRIHGVSTVRFEDADYLGRTCTCTGRDKPIRGRTFEDELADAACSVHGPNWHAGIGPTMPFSVNTYPPHRGHAGGH